jgi:hypothetical protein
MTVDADDVFLFFGAGASLSPPSCLPLFDWLREEILAQLQLDAYVTSSPAREPGKVAVAQSLTPEPFFRDLTHAGVDVEGWLHGVLGGGTPNTAHRAAAELAEAGAQVWTVNFDHLIEKALTTPVGVSRWPDDPDPAARILKPHGSLGGSLVVRSEQVLSGLPPPWDNKLRADVAGRTVIFLGYSGRDLDLRPLWADVLAAAQRVIWFDVRLPDGTVRDEADKRRMLGSINDRGDVAFPLPTPPPPGVSRAAPPNPSWDFVSWCASNGLFAPDSADARRLFDSRPSLSYPALQSAAFARPRLLGHLGDYRGARKNYRQLILTSDKRREAAALLLDSEITHAGRVLALALRPALLVPDRLGRDWKPRLRRKLLTVDHRYARHRRVLRATRSLQPHDVSTLLILRASSLRVRGSLEDAAQTAARASVRARAEEHSVRVAHAAYQECMALVWADRADEAREALETRLRPYAAVAAIRWVAWADFIEGEIAVRSRDVGAATAAFDAADVRFGAERLIDGLISVATARLTVERLAGDDDAFAQRLDHLQTLRRSRGRGRLYYTRGNRFTSEAIEVELAEFARVHSHDLVEAGARYKHLARSSYPLHQALGWLGLSLVNTELNGADRAGRERAKRVGLAIGQSLVVQRAADLEAG